MAKKDGRTNRFVVPVIDLDVTSRALMSGEQPALDASETKFIESGTDAHAVPEQAEGVAPSADRVESPEPVVGSGSGDSPASPATISEPQRKRMMAIARERNVATDDLKAIVADLAGVTSSKAIPVDRYDVVIAGIENWSELHSMAEEVE